LGFTATKKHPSFPQRPQTGSEAPQTFPSQNPPPPEENEGGG